MNILKNELLSILPLRWRSALGQETLNDLQELRLRTGQPPTLVCVSENRSLPHTVTSEDLRFVLHSASRYSPWNAVSVQRGYLTAPGGHRIGLCGETAGDTLRNLTSLCIRICRDVEGISASLTVTGSTLIIGPPGAGKTTLLRDLIRRISQEEACSISVVDERCEIFPCSAGQSNFDPGPHTDILSGTEKARGISMVLRSMGPNWIAVDEITEEADCRALIQAGWCGVRLLATAHASDMNDLRSRPIYRPLLNSGLFRNVIIMHPDLSFRQERI